MRLTLTLLFIQILALSCTPEQSVTDFSISISVPIGEDLTLETEEDTDLTVLYTIQKDENSIDLSMSVTKQPQNGTVKECHLKTELEIECIYSPNKDFSGIDFFEITNKDGEYSAKASSKITINVTDIPDAPRALDLTINGKENTLLAFEIPEGIDPDSLNSELTYELQSSPSDGILSNCLNRLCSYTSNQFFNGVETLTYKITDQTGLVSNTGTITININSEVQINTETFTQGVSNLSGVDIVWVIDNSGSMANNQATLQSNFESFINNFLTDGKAKFDFNMAVTTTDIYEKGMGTNPFQTNADGNIYDLTSTKAESDFTSFKADFEEAVLVGTKGSGHERVFTSIEAAYNYLPEWYGDDTRMLAYIVLTDEPEQSGGSAPLWVEGIQQLKSKTDRLKIFPIVGVDTGDRFKTAADMTGTKVYDIDSSFQTILDDISLTVSTGIASFNLNPLANIIANTVEVTVDGIPTVDFVYSDHKVTLATPPAPYSTIVVTYKYGAL